VYRSKDQVIGQWRRLHNEELYDLYSSPNIIRGIKSRMRWGGNVACMAERRVYKRFWWENRRETDHLEDLDVGGRIILK
jgi:hypothetical protein